MAKTLGSVTISGTGTASGSGLIKSIYDVLITKFATIPSGAAGVSAKEQVADLSRGMAPSLFALLAYDVTGTKTSTYTAAFFELVLLDPTGGAFTVNLPAISAGDVGSWIVLKNDSNSTNVVTLDGNGSDTIDGLTTVTMGSSRVGNILIAKSTSAWIRGTW